MQDPFLFTGTIETNIRLGTPGIGREDVEHAVREVGLADFIHSLPDGVSTSVNERGSTLSVGQRQLINFARALAHNPRFLILDEATSSVDTKTELLIREALDRLLTARKIPHEFHIYPGGHGLEYFLRHFPATMEFHSRAFGLTK